MKTAEPLIAHPPEPLTSQALTVYFDGSCPLCRQEIALYQGLKSTTPVAWVDVSSGVPLGGGLDCAQAMRRFHVRDTQGELHSGAAAFSRLWLVMPGWHWLGRMTALPPVNWLAEGAYRGFLQVRPRLQQWAGARLSKVAP